MKTYDGNLRKGKKYIRRRKTQIIIILLILSVKEPSQLIIELNEVQKRTKEKPLICQKKLNKNIKEVKFLLFLSSFTNFIQNILRSTYWMEKQHKKVLSRTQYKKLYMINSQDLLTYYYYYYLHIIDIFKKEKWK